MDPLLDSRISPQSIYLGATITILIAPSPTHIYNLFNPADSPSQYEISKLNSLTIQTTTSASPASVILSDFLNVTILKFVLNSIDLTFSLTDASASIEAVSATKCMIDIINAHPYLSHVSITIVDNRSDANL